MSRNRKRQITRQCALALVSSAATICLGHADDAPAYYEDIAPIFEAHCVVCHRPGEVAPMSLMEYDLVRPWANSILEKISSREMPPFHAEGPIGRYEDDLRLTDDQIAIVERWIKSGAKRGDPASFERTKDWAVQDWPAGPPDLVIKFPRFTLRNDGVDPYVYLFTDFNPQENIWVRGFDWRFNHRQFVHHVIAGQLDNGVSPPPSRMGDPMRYAIRMRPGGAAGADYLPGAGPRFLPGNSVNPILAGGYVYGVFHFAPNSEQAPLAEEPQLGFYLADGEYPNQFYRMDLVTMDISIAPGESNFVQIVRNRFDVDSFIWDFHIHMHNRGKSADVNLYYPDGRAERIFHMPRFSFDWQRHYYLNEPVKVPAGTVAEFIGVWDNSANNPSNPDPTQRVEYGSLTSNEMGNANLSYTHQTPSTVPMTMVKGARQLETEAKAAERAATDALHSAVQAMSKVELETLLEQQPPENRPIVISIWELKNGPYEDPSAVTP